MQPVTSLSDGRLTVRVKDQQGNWSVMDRVFEVGSASAQIAQPCPTLMPLFSPPPMTLGPIPAAARGRKSMDPWQGSRRRQKP